MSTLFQFPFVLLFFLYGVLCNQNLDQNYPILSVEEINSIHCMGKPQPYNGPPQLESLLSEMYTASNGKLTYYIFPLEKILQVNNLNPKDRTCAGVFSGFKTDPYNNKEISLNYQSGDYCPGHRLKSTELIIHCDRSTADLMEIHEVSELNHCESHIEATSPIPCMISKNSQKQVNLDSIEERLNMIRQKIDMLHQDIQKIIDK